MVLTQYVLKSKENIYAKKRFCEILAFVRFFYRGDEMLFRIWKKDSVVGKHYKKDMQVSNNIVILISNNESLFNITS